MFRTDASQFIHWHQWIVYGAFFVFGIYAIATAIAEPYIPQTDDQIIQRLATSRTDDDRQLYQLRRYLQENPDNLALALHLAGRYIATGNTLSDPRFYGYAQAVLKPWWDLQQPPEQVLLIRAKLQQKQHAFSAALADLEQLIIRQPRNAQAWLEQSVLLRVQGRYKEALNSCLPLRQLTQGIVSSVCIANAASLNGRARDSYRLLQQSLQQYPDADNAMRLWALTLMAEIAVQLGEQKQAEQDFQQALSLAADDGYLLATYADFLLQRERPQAVVTLLTGKENNDTLLLLLSIAEQRLQLPGWQAHRAMLAARIEAAQLRGGYAHLRTAARYTLDILEQAEQALQLAQSNWAKQREPADARLLLRAALAAAQPEAARAVREWLSETGLEDANCQILLAQIAAL